MEENAVKDYGQPNCETSQEIGHDDDGNSKPRRNVIRVVDDLSTDDSGGGDTDGWNEWRWVHGTIVDEVGSEQKDADSDACAYFQYRYQTTGTGEPIVSLQVTSIHIIPIHHIT